jgi:hypothetical protein
MDILWKQKLVYMQRHTFFVTAIFFWSTPATLLLLMEACMGLG